MQRLEVSGAVRPIYGSLGVKWIIPALYRGADKSLARPEGKQARKHVRDARDFNNIGTRAVKFFFSPARQGAEGNSTPF